MIGTVVNAGAVVAGSALGVGVGSRLSERFKGILMQCLGLGVVLVGLQMCVPTRRPLLAIACLAVGGLAGEALGIEAWLGRAGEWLRGRLGSSSGTFAEGFASATVLYCTGAMMIVGSIQDGVAGDPSTLYMKALLDGAASVALASSLGVGVAFSSLSILATQGPLTLLAAHVGFLQRPDVLEAVSATGGLLISGIGLNLLGATHIRTGNLMPAALLAIGAALVR